MANEEALKEKEQGNAAYKSKNFTKAIQHYQKVRFALKVEIMVWYAYDFNRSLLFTMNLTIVGIELFYVLFKIWN